MIAEPLTEFLIRGAILLSVACLIGWRFSNARDSHRFGRGVVVLLWLMAVAGMMPAWQWLELDLGSEPVTAFLEASGSATIVDAGESSPAAPGSFPGTQDLRPEGDLRSLSLTTFLIGIWQTGIAVGLLRLVFSRVRLACLLRDARRIEVDGVCLWQSARISSPLSFGAFRGGIVVPEGFEIWPEAERRMVVLHERRHLERRDGGWLGLAKVMAVLHWPNPLAWWACRRFERDCELAVDAEVLERGTSPSAYSQLLVRLASGAAAAPAPEPAMAMARKSSVPLRVEKILTARRRGQVSAGPLLWLALGFLGGVAVTVGVTSIGKRDGDQLTVRTVFVDPAASAEGELYTRTYVVPPTFGSNVGAEGEDPFAPDAEPKPRRPVREYLEEVGIAFPGESTAVYSSATSQVVMRNTIENHELMEVLQESVQLEMKRARVQIYLTTKMVEGPREAVELEVGEEGQLAGVMTDAQFQVTVRALNQKKNVDLLTAPSLMIRSGQRGKVEISEQEGFPDFLLETEGLIGADGFTIDLTLHQWIESTGRPATLTIGDGQTVIWTEPIDDDRVRATFVTARLVDPSGKPMNPRLHSPPSEPSGGDSDADR